MHTLIIVVRSPLLEVSLWRNGLAHWTSNSKVVGSSPTRDGFFLFFHLAHKLYTPFTPLMLIMILPYLPIFRNTHSGRFSDD